MVILLICEMPRLVQCCLFQTIMGRRDLGFGDAPRWWCGTVSESEEETKGIATSRRWVIAPKDPSESLSWGPEKSTASSSFHAASTTCIICWLVITFEQLLHSCHHHHHHHSRFKALMYHSRFAGMSIQVNAKDHPCLHVLHECSFSLNSYMEQPI